MEKKKNLMMHKSDLSCYCQKLSIPFPLYQTSIEGCCGHGFRFRSTVSVGERSFTSSNTFANRKSAEQDVAKLALEQLVAEGEASDANLRLYLRKLVCQDKARCKMILNEFSAKMKMECVYVTVQVQSRSMFVSTLTLNGNCYRGEASKSKKEAEKLAALVAIRLLLDDPKYATPISKVIKSKFNVCPGFYEATECKTTAFNCDVILLNQQDSSIEQSSFRDLVNENMPTPINLRANNVVKQGGPGIVVNETKQDSVSSLPRTEIIVNKNKQDLANSLPWTEMAVNKNKQDLVSSLPPTETVVNQNKQDLVVSLPQTEKQGGLENEAVTISRCSYVCLPTNSPFFSQPRHEIKLADTSQPASQQINVLVVFAPPTTPSLACDLISSKKRRRNKKANEKRKRLRAKNN